MNLPFLNLCEGMFHGSKFAKSVKFLFARLPWHSFSGRCSAFFFILSISTLPYTGQLGGTMWTQ